MGMKSFNNFTTFSSNIMYDHDERAITLNEISWIFTEKGNFLIALNIYML